MANCQSTIKSSRRNSIQASTNFFFDLGKLPSINSPRFYRKNSFHSTITNMNVRKVVLFIVKVVQRNN